MMLSYSFAGYKAYMNIEYTIFTVGCIVVDNSFKSSDVPSVLPRLGVKLELHKMLDMFI